MPPNIKQVIEEVPRVDADGNELGGVPVVLREAPLGTYLGWNITAAGFHQGKLCNYPGGMIPFAKTKAERWPTAIRAYRWRSVMAITRATSRL